MTAAPDDGPVLSVVLATDNYERGRQLIESMMRQTIADRIELVLVTSSPDEVRAATAGNDRFHSIVVAPLDTVVPLSKARSAGVRAASASYIFIAETHAYPDPDVCERVVELLAEGWDLVVPGLRNANPRNGISWGGFLSDYGAWSRALPAGEIERAPAHNTAFRRETLMAFGDDLDKAFGFGDGLHEGMKARGHRAWFEPVVVVEHVNIHRARHWVRERYLSGALIGGSRSAKWPWQRRLLYVAASPLIPFVILSRVRKGIREVGRREALPRGTYPVIVGGVLLKVLGEVRGYLFGKNEKIEAGMTAFEIRKLAFNSGEER
jgi:Glycosyl transferase family 2.